MQRSHIITKRALLLGPWPVQAVVCVASGLLMLGGARLAGALAYDRESVLCGAAWRLWTGNWVHLNLTHYALNAASLAAFSALCPERLRLRDWALRWSVLPAAVGLGLLLFAPSVQQYVGLSGAIYGLLFLGLGREAAQGSRFAWACLAFLTLRIATEFVPGTLTFEERLIGGRVIAASHVFGIIGAAIYALAGLSLRRWRGSPDSPVSSISSQRRH